MKVKIKELKKWRDYIDTLPDELIDMRRWRLGRSDTPECDSIGCIVGHCTALYDANSLPWSGDVVRFSEVAEFKLGIHVDDYLWDFLFSWSWSKNTRAENGSQRAFALDRMDYVIRKGGAPLWWSYDYYMSKEQLLCD